MLREQRLQFFEEKTVSRYSGKRNKKIETYKREIEEIKRNFPEDKKDEIVKILNREPLNNEINNHMEFVNQVLKEIESDNMTAPRFLEIQLKSSKFKKSISHVEKSLNKDKVLTAKASNVIGHLLDNQLDRYKKSITDFGKETDRLLGDVNKVKKTLTNRFAKSACTPIEGLIKNAYIAKCENVEAYLKEMISEMKKLM